MGCRPTEPREGWRLFRRGAHRTFPPRHGTRQFSNRQVRRRRERTPQTTESWSDDKQKVKHPFGFGPQFRMVDRVQNKVSMIYLLLRSFSMSEKPPRRKCIDSHPLPPEIP